MRSAKVILNIDGGDIDLESEYNMYLVDSPDIVCAPTKPFEEEQYPESNGAYIYPKTTMDKFDYKITILYFGERDTANLKIAQLNNLLYAKSGDMLSAKEITVKNMYKNVSIVGYTKSLVGNETDFDSDSDAWFFDLTIQVANPQKCNFNIN